VLQWPPAFVAGGFFCALGHSTSGNRSLNRLSLAVATEIFQQKGVGSTVVLSLLLLESIAVAQLSLDVPVVQVRLELQNVLDSAALSGA
jgi:hypothetical protein